MIEALRTQFNARFTEERYNKLLQDLNSSGKYPVDFRVSETPVFFSKEFVQKLTEAGDDIFRQLHSPAYREFSKAALPDQYAVPDEDDHPLFIQLDYAVVEQDGGYVPKLIELQGFPSLYAYQALYQEKVRQHFPEIPDDYTVFFNGYNKESYIDCLKDIILAGEDPEQVILLEITPELQKTRIDFALTETYLGIRSVCISDLKAEGRKLYYIFEDRKIQVKRIYNRVILDELERKNFPAGFDFFGSYDVEWVGHPNWFYKVSKYSLPFLKGDYVPDCRFLDQVPELPEDLSKYVLKPLFSFAGLGVIIDPERKQLEEISDPQNYILQEKIAYAPVIQTPDEPSKIEVRMMYVWKNEPLLLTNLVRMSKGKMMGVDFNKNKTWVGSSSAFFPGT